jgi:hypothetical protein
MCSDHLENKNKITEAMKLISSLEGRLKDQKETYE